MEPESIMMKTSWINNTHLEFNVNFSATRDMVMTFGLAQAGDEPVDVEKDALAWANEPQKDISISVTHPYKPYGHRTDTLGMLPVFRGPYNTLMANGHVRTARLISRWVAPIIEEIILWLKLITEQEWIDAHDYSGKERADLAHLSKYAQRKNFGQSFKRIALHRHNNIRYEETGKGALSMTSAHNSDEQIKTMEKKDTNEKKDEERKRENLREMARFLLMILLLLLLLWLLFHFLSNNPTGPVLSLPLPATVPFKSKPTTVVHLTWLPKAGRIKGWIQKRVRKFIGGYPLIPTKKNIYRGRNGSNPNNPWPALNYGSAKGSITSNKETPSRSAEIFYIWNYYFWIFPMLVFLSLITIVVTLLKVNIRVSERQIVLYLAGFLKNSLSQVLDLMVLTIFTVDIDYTTTTFEYTMIV